MNLHPLTLVLLLALAFLFYSQGQVFFFFTTVAIGFLLLVVSLSEPAHHGHESSGSSHGSLYPEKIEIKVTGDDGDHGDGQKELGESVGGFVDFTGKLISWALPNSKRYASKDDKKEEKKEEKKPDAGASGGAHHP